MSERKDMMESRHKAAPAKNGNNPASGERKDPIPRRRDSTITIRARIKKKVVPTKVFRCITGNLA
jgi:hypothetical protein